jgi:hypothetical protein
MTEIIITKKYLKDHPNEIFVFGDNLKRIGYGGAAILRDEKNTYGFLTKRYPDNNDASFYRPSEYEPIFEAELERLIKEIKFNPTKTFLISKLGAGLANKYFIFEAIIEPTIKSKLKKFPNVRFLW